MFSVKFWYWVFFLDSLAQTWDENSTRFFAFKSSRFSRKFNTVSFQKLLAFFYTNIQHWVCLSEVRCFHCNAFRSFKVDEKNPHRFCFQKQCFHKNMKMSFYFKSSICSMKIRLWVVIPKARCLHNDMNLIQKFSCTSSIVSHKCNK